MHLRPAGYACTESKDHWELTGYESRFYDLPSEPANKSAELEVHQLIEASVRTRAAGLGDKAVEQARAAHAKLEWVRAEPAGEPASPNSARCPAHLAELAVAASYNLASQLASAGQQSEAVGLYAELSRAGASTSAADPGPHLAPCWQRAAAAGQQLGELRASLLRLGLELGNGLMAQGEQQRALKYYRLTLDRLAGVRGQARARVRLQHNIALALGGLERRRLVPATDVLGAYKVLLASNGAPTSAQHQANPGELANAHQHRFSLGLMVWQHASGDAQALQETLGMLASLPRHPHYTRVDSCASQDQKDDLERALDGLREDWAQCLRLGTSLVLDLHSNDRSEARRACERLLETGSDEHRGLVRELRASEAARMLALGSLDSGRELLSQLASGDPSPSEPQSMLVANNLSAYMLAEGRRDQARAMAEVASKLEPQSDFRPLCNLSAASSEAREAQQFASEALAAEPGLWAAAVNLARANRALGRKQQPVGDTTTSGSGRNQLLQEQQQQMQMQVWSPAVASELLSLQQALAAGQAAGSVEALLSEPSPAPELALLASQAGLAGAASSAEALLRRAHRAHPYQARLAGALAELELDKFDFGAARGLLELCAFRLRPESVQWHRLLADSWRRAGDFQAAVGAYRRAIEAFAHDTSCPRALLELATELGLSQERAYAESKLRIRTAQLSEPTSGGPQGGQSAGAPPLEAGR